MKKTCFKCGHRKDISMFYAHPQMADGHLGKCKKCAKNDAKARRCDPKSRARIIEYERFRFGTAERKNKIREYQISRRKNTPGVVRARTAVSNAIRDGRLERKPCEVCGDIKSQAHHYDYRKKLSVVWLCFKHHRESHGQTVGHKPKA